MPEDTSTEGLIELEDDKRNTPDYWRRWVKKASQGEAPKRHRESAAAAWREYEKEETLGSGGSVLEGNRSAKPYPIYWSSCKTLEPAYYSRTPKVLSKRKGGISDAVALTMSLIIERMGEHFEDCTDFDDVMQSAVLDFIHADKATTQVSYEMEDRVRKVPVPLMLGPEGDSLIDEAGVPFEGDWKQDGQGGFFYEKEEIYQAKKIKFMPCPYDEVLHTPDAKCETEIYEKAYYFFLPEDEAKKRFPGKEFNWKTGDRTKEDKSILETPAPTPLGKYIEGWECWCKSTKKVYWISEQFEGGFLDVKDDPYKLRGFFPSAKFILGSRPSKHLYPTPVFMQLLPLIDELHCAADRISILIERIKRRALVDGSNVELLAALNSLSDGEYVAVDNLQQVLEKGGVENLVWFIPVKELVDCITELSQIQEKFKNEFFEWFGVPDILRGQTDPIETAAAQEMKTGAAQDRFKFPKKLVARLARDSIEMMIDLALSVMSDEEIGEIVNVRHMDPGHQSRFAQALADLRADEIRMVRVDIDTDTMSFLDDQLRSAKINNGVVTLSRGLEQISQMLQIDPSFAAVALQALLLSLESMGLGKEFEDMVREGVNALIEKAKNPPEPPPPPPDYEMMKIEVSRMKAETNAMAKQRELDQAEYRLNVQQAQIQAKAENDAAKTEIEAFNAKLDEVVQSFMMQVEAQRLQLEEARVDIENFKAQIQAQETMLEEVRLAKETKIAQYSAAVETAKTEDPKSPEAPVVNVINVESAKEQVPVPVLPVL